MNLKRRTAVNRVNARLHIIIVLSMKNREGDSLKESIKMKNVHR